ncbi:MAG: hypothetical protein IPK13_13110 [Deltaproteobacteria bacterium]|nr:hypothetical protein [Deltaproteobacteria bacterium]
MRPCTESTARGGKIRGGRSAQASLAALVALSTTASPPATAQTRASSGEDPRQDVGDTVSVALIKVGQGFLVADGVSRIPLEVRIARPLSVAREPLVSAEIHASLGVASRVHIKGPEVISFSYAPPLRAHGTDETMTVALRYGNGVSAIRRVRFHVPPPTRRLMSIRVEPETLTRNPQTPVTIEARSAASKAEATDLRIEVEYGRVISTRTREGESITTRATLIIPDDVGTVPDRIVAVAIATSPNGFSVDSADIDVEPGQPRADGCFVVGLPGQAVADGGVGPTIVLARPRPTFRGPIAWPLIHTEGAALLNAHKVHDSLQVLTLDRPREARDVAVFLDRKYCGLVRLRPALQGTTPVETTLDAPREGLTREGGTDEGGTREGGTREGGTREGGTSREEPSPPREDPVSNPSAGVPEPTHSAWGTTLSASVIVGSTLHGMGARGANITLAATPPLLGKRLMMRSGIELTFLRSDGTLSVAESVVFPAVATTTVTELLLELGIVVLRLGRLELLATGGSGLRRTVIEVAADKQTLASGSTADVTGRASLEAQLSLGDVRLVVGSGLAGLGRSVRFARAGNTLADGSQLTVRGFIGAALEL